uniref:Uncharacterized protein n=1 Tax=Cacopsylla melanoneura TaxID=428564 RepID=A0A8D8MAH9_9HEMI
MRPSVVMRENLRLGNYLNYFSLRIFPYKRGKTKNAFIIQRSKEKLKIGIFLQKVFSSTKGICLYKRDFPRLKVSTELSAETIHVFSFQSVFRSYGVGVYNL